MLEKKPSLAQISDGFSWEIPEFYNIGVDVCDKWAQRHPDRLAIIDVYDNGQSKQYTFSDLQRLSNKLANALSGLGLGNKTGDIGDRIGILLPQCIETAVAHIASAKMGCVALPLFTLFGEDALLHRLKDSGAKAVVTDTKRAATLSLILDQLPDLNIILSIDGNSEHATCFYRTCDGMSERFNIVKTRADDAALIIYTSGTTGNPKGALHAHRVLLGHLPGVEISHNFLPFDNDRFWTPADWAWIGGLLDVLMPALHHGIPVVASRFAKFDATAAFELLRDYRINNAFLPPTALKIMMQQPALEQYNLAMRSVASGGESLGHELIAWGKKVFGTTINEFYGQTECNMVVSCCSAVEPPVPGAMGRSVPGHTVDIIHPETGDIQADDQEGAIAILAPNPVMFLGYWNNIEATEHKYLEGPDGRWLLTGDTGSRDADGRLHFLGRQDDVINSAGYRIGPAEIEYCLIKHPAVQLAAVVGKPDKLRGSVVAAYVTLNEHYSPSDELAQDIASYVKVRLSAHEYPRVVNFINEMPMTTTGKLIRARLRRLAAQNDDL